METLMRSLATTIFLLLFTNLAVAEDCIASVYSIGDSSQPGNKTASGIPLNNNALTAAHKTLPFRTRVNVTNKSNGKSVVVTIIDRGPWVRGRCIDMTPAGARAIGMNGLAPVTIEIVSRR
jgi:rare lipoprotein A